MKNYKGIRNGSLVVIGLEPVKKKDSAGRKIAYVVCLCDCGKTKEVRVCNLKSTKSCGCRSLPNKKYGRLTVSKEFKIIRTDKSRTHKEWKCKCECGNIKYVSTANLNSGHVRSCGCISVLPDRLAVKRRILYTYKRNAKKRKLTFDLTFDNFVSLIESECFYCGKVGSNLKIDYSGEYMYNGIDRIDNSKGYSVQNTVASCSRCNYAKRDMSLSDFKNLVSKIYHRIVV